MKALRVLGIILGLISLQSTLLAGSKTDTIYFQGGSRIRGEVKSLVNDLLTLSTDEAGTINIEWTEVDSVHFSHMMRIVLENGDMAFGLILPAGVEKECIIWRSEGDPMQVALNRIVAISPIEERFIERLSGSVSSGFSYTKASEVMQINLNGSLQYLSKKNLIKLSYDGLITQDPVSGTHQRQNGGFSFYRRLAKKWFLTAQLMAESNSELQLDLRTSFGIGPGRKIIHTNSTDLHVMAGILTNREKSSELAQNNLEGIAEISYSVYIYKQPEVILDLRSNFMPSMTNPGRIRSETDSSLKWEIFSDFYLRWTFYYSFDSEPLGDGEKNDWAVTLLGFEYKL